MSVNEPLPSSTRRAETFARGARDDEADLDLSGTLLAERYRVLERLGAGGMGTVYLAEHVVLGKRVAVKVLSTDYWSRGKSVSRFLHEAKTASQVRHENIVEITDFGFADETIPFFVMELLEGEDLGDLVEREAPLAWPRVRELMLQILAALEAAHAAGVVHRDMKPRNCFVVERGELGPQIKVLDFGIAKVMGDEVEGTKLTKTGTVIGTAHYMSPEQAKTEALDARADVYSAGVIAFELLTGRVPYDATGFFNVLLKLMTEELPAMASVAPEVEVHPEVEAVVRKAMAKDREERYASAAEFGAAIRALPSELAAVAKPRSPWLVALGLAGLVLLGLVLAWPLVSGSGQSGRVAGGEEAGSAQTEGPEQVGAQAPAEPASSDARGAEAAAAVEADPAAGAAEPAAVEADPTEAAGAAVAVEPAPESDPTSEGATSKKKAAKRPSSAEPAELPEQPPGEAIAKVLRRAEQASIACGDAHDAIAPSVSIEFEITPAGEVEGARVGGRMAGSSVGTCVKLAVEKLEFPASRSGASRRHTFPLHER